MAVRLADSTLRSGETVIWEGGQQSMNCSWATWALFNERLCISRQREDNAAMTATVIIRISSRIHMLEQAIRCNEVGKFLYKTTYCCVVNH
jgi:hypothetical protein